RPLGNLTARNLAFGRCHLIERAAKMNGASTLTGPRVPGNGSRERVIDFENPGRVPEIFEPAAIAIGQSASGNPGEIPNRSVEKNGARVWQLREVVDAALSVDPAAELVQIRGERIRNRLRPAAGDRPSDRVPC